VRFRRNPGNVRGRRVSRNSESPKSERLSSSEEVFCGGMSQKQRFWGRNKG